MSGLILRAAVRDVHGLFERAQLIQGHVVLSAADVFGWTLTHAGAINAALTNPTQSAENAEQPSGVSASAGTPGEKGQP